MLLSLKRKHTGKKRHHRRIPARVRRILEPVTRCFRSRTKLGIALVLCLLLMGIGLVVSRNMSSRSDVTSVQKGISDQSDVDVLFAFESTEKAGDDAAFWDEFSQEETSDSAHGLPSDALAGPTLLPAEPTHESILQTGGSQMSAPAFPATRTAKGPPPSPNAARWPPRPTGAWLTGTIEEVHD